TDEWMDACKELWTAEFPKFSGKYVKFDDVVFIPKPVQNPIPIWVGGESGPALRRTAKYAHGWYPVGTNPQFPMNRRLSWLREPDSNPHYGCRIDDSLPALDFPALRDRFAAALSECSPIEPDEKGGILAAGSTLFGPARIRPPASYSELCLTAL